MEIKQFKLGEIRSNCYLITKGKRLFIVDPGFEDDELIKYINDNKLILEVIYITHGHFDHCGGVKRLKDLYNPIVYAPIKDKIWLDDTPYNRWLYTIPVDTWIKDNDIISWQGIDFKVIETPGHSEGSTGILYKNLFFAGDTLFFESIGRTDIPFSNFEVIKKTILNLYDNLNDDVIIYPGHGRTTTIFHERHNNPFVRKENKK